MNRSLLLLVFLLPFLAIAGRSAKRPAALSWKVIGAQKEDDDTESVYNSRKAWKDSDFSKVPVWDSMDNLNKIFNSSRDLRYLTDPTVAAFLRRISWLFPDDGCFARAALVNSLIEKNSAFKVQRIFIFGDLSVNTSNSPEGSVTWWYHTTNMAKVNDKIYILDAAIEPKNILEINDWIARQHVVKENAEFNVCDQNAYDPDDECWNSASDTARATQEEASYLGAERERQSALGRDANQVLGDHPPWLN